MRVSGEKTEECGSIFYYLCAGYLTLAYPRRLKTMQQKGKQERKIAPNSMRDNWLAVKGRMDGWLLPQFLWFLPHYAILDLGKLVTKQLRRSLEEAKQPL